MINKKGRAMRGFFLHLFPLISANKRNFGGKITMYCAAGVGSNTRPAQREQHYSLQQLQLNPRSGSARRVLQRVVIPPTSVFPLEAS